MIKVPNHHFVGDGKGGWLKRPGRIKMRLSVLEHGPSDAIADAVIQKSSRLQGRMLPPVRERLRYFLQAYLDLETYLSTPIGDVPVQADGAKVRNLWHLYLVRGRELIDILGSVVHLCFKLNGRRNGLNAKTLAGLKTDAAQLSGKLDGIECLLACIEAHEELVISFIDLRNRDKDRNNTLVEPPFISETGDATEGVLDMGAGAREDFVRYLRKSYQEILGFCCCFLGSEVPN